MVLALSAAAETSHDSLDVSLHDGELAEEVELVALLIVAANDSERALSQPEVDQILGVPRRLSLTVPLQPSTVED